MRIATITFAGLLLGSCAGSKTEPNPEPQQAAASDIELNLPESVVSTECDCTETDIVADNYFDHGVRALAARDYDQAKKYFQKHRETGDSEAAREADVGMAFLALLTESVPAGSEASRSAGVDERAEMMILALAAVKTLEGRIDTLDALNKALSQDLEKREDALKRLRDLTLGQEEGGR